MGRKQPPGQEAVDPRTMRPPRARAQRTAATFSPPPRYGGMIASLVTLLIYLVIAGLIFWAIWWALSQLPIPEPFATAIRVVVVLVAVLIVVYALLGIVPGPHLALR